MPLRDVLTMPVDAWQAWSWRCETDTGGWHGVQRLLAMLIAMHCSSPEKPVDWRDVAPWLAPGRAESESEQFLRQVRRRAPALLDLPPREMRRRFDALFPDASQAP